MIESIRAIPIAGTKPIEVQVTNRVPLHGGGAELKRIIEGKIDSEKISLIERLHDETFIENWIIWNMYGLPTFPYLSESEDKKWMYSTDVKADGSEVYGAGLRNILLDPEAIRERPRPDIDKIFLQLITPDNFSLIEAQAHEFLAKANAAHIKLSIRDPFELIVHPDRTWGPITLDLVHNGDFNPRANPSVLRDNQIHNETAIMSQLLVLRGLGNLLRNAKSGLSS